MGLLNGTICLKYKCSKCCENTEMILTESDIRRIVKLGYKLKEFAYFDGEYWRLKNVNGKCYFLGEDGRCRIYEHRPLGCIAYPIVKINGKCAPDFEVCPYAKYATETEIKMGCKILKRIFKELREGYNIGDLL